MGVGVGVFSVHTALNLEMQKILPSIKTFLHPVKHATTHLFLSYDIHTTIHESVMYIIQAYFLQSD